MTPDVTDKFTKVGNPGSATTLSAPGYTIGDTSMAVGSTTNWPADTKVIFAVDRAQVVSGVEERIAGTYCEFEGIVTGANTISDVSLRFGNAQNYPAGSLTRVYIPVAATRENDMVEGLALEHHLDGRHDETKVAMLAGSQTFTGNKEFDGNVDFDGDVDLAGATVKNPTPNTSRFTGEIATCYLRTAPAGWLDCDGAAVSRSTYADLFAALFPSLGTVTITIASPGVVTLNNHGLLTGAGIYLTTTGALPTGLSANTRYYVIAVNANTFRLATSQANATAGTAINTSGSQSGTHTLFWAPTGIGDGSTTFNTPDFKGRVLVGLDASDADFNTLGKSVGAKTVTLTWQQSGLPPHSHEYAGISGAGSGEYGPSNLVSPTNNATSTRANVAQNAGQAHPNVQPSTAALVIIKT